MVALLRDVEQAAAGARDALRGRAAELLRRAQRERIGGALDSEVALLVLADGADALRSVHESVCAYEDRLNALRAQLVHVLVDESGMSFTELARRMGLSRQRVAQYYRGPGRSPRKRSVRAGRDRLPGFE